MAVVKYSALVDQLRGRLNGTVLSAFKNGYNAYRKGQPSRTGSASQQVRRQQMQHASQAWSKISPADRFVWSQVAAATPVKNRLGDMVTLSPFNYFVKYHLWNSYVAGNTLDSPTNTLSSAYSTEYHFTTVNVTQQQDGKLLLSLSGTADFLATSTEENLVFFSISQPQSTDSANFDSTQSMFYTEVVPSNLGPFTGSPFNLTGVPVSDYFKTWQDAYHRIDIFFVTKQSMQASLVQQIVVQSNYTPAAPPVWSIVFIPTFSSSNIAYGNDVGGGKIGLFNADVYGKWSIGLTGSATDYNVQWMTADVSEPTQSAGPEYFSGSEPSVTEAMYYISPTDDTVSLIINPGSLVSYSLDDRDYTTADKSRYIPIKFRIQKTSDLLWSDFFYSYITIV